MKRLLSLAVLALLATGAFASDFASHHLLVPIAGRTAGAFGTQWKTDLVVANAARNGEPLTAEVYLIVEGRLTPPVALTLRPLQSFVMTDVIRGVFGRDNAFGIILIAVREPDAKLTARARVYNTTASGQYGQTVQALPLTKLSKEAVLPGLSGIQGNRTNVGISNPDAAEALVTISLYDSAGEFRGSFTTAVAPYSLLRLNDVFSHFQAGPLDGAMIRVQSSKGVYAFASIVRNDTGDADFVTATATELDESQAVVPPQCESPSTLSLAALPSVGWTVLYKPGIDPFTSTPELEARHGFDAEHIYLFGGFYTRALTPAKIAALRCEGDVRVVEQNALVPIF